MTSICQLCRFGFLAAIFVMGCAKTITVGHAFLDSEKRFFDDGIDVVSGYQEASGQFLFEARQDIDARSNLANVVALVTIVSVQTNDMSGGIEERRIEVNVEQVLYGELQHSKYQLRSASSSLGYALLNRHEAALEGKKILFLRTFPPTENGVDHHFHLSPGDASVVAEVTPFLKKRLEAEVENKDKDKDE